MRVQSIVVKHFRKLTSARLALDDVTLVLGPNGAGKSSLCEAVRYALTGECNLSDARGAGIARNIEHGEKTATIDLATDGPAIMRTIAAKGSTVSVDDNAQADALAALDVLYPPTEVLKCMLSSGYFVGLKPKDQQAVLCGIAGQPVDADWVREQLGDRSKALKDAIEQTNLQGPDLLDHLYKSAYAARTALNRLAKDAKSKVSGDEPEALPEADLQRLVTARAKALEKLSFAQGALQASAQQIAANERAAKACTEVGDRLRRAREALRLSDIPQAPDEDALETLRAEAKHAADDLQSAQNSKAAAKGALEAMLKQAATFRGAGSQCVALETLACPLTDEQRAEARDGCDRLCNDLQSAEHAAAANVSEAEARAKSAREQLQEAESAANRYAAQIQSRNDAEADVARLSAENERLTAVYQQTPAASAETLEANVREAQEAYNRADAACQAAQQAQRDVETWAEHKREARKAAKAAELMDGLVKDLSPEGLPAKAMQETVGVVVDAVNRVLAELKFSPLSIEPGAEFELAVKDGEYTTPVALLSESEKLRVGIALQLAFAHLTEFGFVVVDAADRLDGPNRGRLIKTLLASGVQALVTATPANGGRPELDGLAVYGLENGTAVRCLPAVDEEGEAA